MVIVIRKIIIVRRTTTAAVTRITVCREFKVRQGSGIVGSTAVARPPSAANTLHACCCTLGYAAVL